MTATPAATAELPTIHVLTSSTSINDITDFDAAIDTLEPAKNEQPISPYQRQQQQQQETDNKEHQTDCLFNAASLSQGARVLFATDEWFAAADNLLKDSPPQFDPVAYCEQGKVMDGWETRRRREVGHDWCVIKLAQRTNVTSIELDTAHFTGNHVPAISLQVADVTCLETQTKLVLGFPDALERLLLGCGVQGTGMRPDQVQQAQASCDLVTWQTLLPRTSLRPGYEPTRMHWFTLEQPITATHVRVNFFPDGGVARLKLWGMPARKQPFRPPTPLYAPIRTGRTCAVVSHSSDRLMPSQEPYPFPELSSMDQGGMGLICSNKHYGEPYNLIQSNFGRDMGDGWETARHPNRPSILVTDPATGLVDSPLMDWCVLKLGQVATRGIVRIILDTKHFRGNYPESVLVEGCFVESDDPIMMMTMTTTDTTTVATTDEAEHAEAGAVEWFPLVARCRMAPDSEHVFESSKEQILNHHRKVSHIKVSIFPDGGLSRVRVYGAVGELQ